jgi:PilZ domain
LSQQPRTFGNLYSDLKQTIYITVADSDQQRDLSIPSAPPDARRRFPRVPLVTAVELQTACSVAYGFSENISLGGMLVRSEVSLAPATPALTTFVLRGAGRMQIESRVVHCRPGVRTGLEFVRLTEVQQTILKEFAQPKITTLRRSARIPVRLFLELSWIDRGQMLDALAETVLISRHGCLVLTKADVAVGRHISLKWPDIGIGTRARVVSRQDCASELPRIAMEFVETDSFWGSYFPANG